MTRPTVGFLGMTHLGLVSATAVAAKGFPTLCCDPDPALIDGLKRRVLPVAEPDLPELLAGNGDLQCFYDDPKSLADCDLVYVSADVPTDDAGQSDLASIRRLIDVAATAMAGDAVLVILCQVPPGFTRSLGVIALERLYYQVETLVFGQAVQRAMKPERFIVGCAFPDQPLHRNYAALLEAFGCPILPMRYESAELAKIAINMCLVASISVANTAAELCESVGADWSEIAPALKLDRRIGPHSYLSPGLGIAGGNLERDLATFERLAREHGTDATIVRAWLANSRHRRDWAAQKIRRALLDKKPDAIIGIWGLAYKENTHSVKNSPSLATIAQLSGVRIRAHDPWVPQAAVADLPITRAQHPMDAVRGADALMILTPWPQYRDIAPEQIAAALNGRIVIDPYSVLDLRATEAAGLAHYTLGRPVRGLSAN
jgi:UDPglucose 6-dehydrogenase